MSSPLRDRELNDVAWFQPRMIHNTVDDDNIDPLCRILAAQDEDLAFVHRSYGAPPAWNRQQGFCTLVQIILEQQVSLASAKAAFEKLSGSFEDLTPVNLLTLSDNELKSIGFSRQKTSYVRVLAEAILNKAINLDGFEKLSDLEIRGELIKLKGIGDWTADIYLLMAMRRPDIMPRNDLALLAAYQNLKDLRERPTSDEFIRSAERWRPLRSVAARLLWHFYLSQKKKN